MGVFRGGGTMFEPITPVGWGVGEINGVIHRVYPEVMVIPIGEHTPLATFSVIFYHHHHLGLAGKS